MKCVTDWLEKKNLTQRELATDLGVSEGAVSQWLSGDTTPTIMNLQKLASRTGIPVAVLVAECAAAA